MIFRKIYLDAMLMPVSKAGYRYIIAARDDLTLGSEGKALRGLTSKAVFQFLNEYIYCRYGAFDEIVTDNGSETKGAVDTLNTRLGIKHIRISPYNSKANGVVERGHFILREAIVKACDGDLTHWEDKVPHAFFADRITTRASTGFSPFYLIHGVEPVLPLDLTEANLLVDGFQRDMTTTELLALCIRQLEKCPGDIARAAETLKQTRLRSKEQFESRYANRIMTEPFAPGTLVLKRNTRVEKELNRKTKPRYLGPFEVVRRTPSGSYILKELNGSVIRESVAAFRVIRYYPRNEVEKIIPTIDDDEDEGEEEVQPPKRIAPRKTKSQKTPQNQEDTDVEMEEQPLRRSTRNKVKRKH